ncbi:MAG: DUF1499 domain-containing protein [Acidobacteriota bacterium]|jgi:uncharacterized protein (DUF1499 family)
MNLNKLFSALIVAIILFAMSPLVLVRIWPMINDVRTGETPQYADLQPQRLAGRSIGEAFDAAMDVVAAMEWEIREANRDQGVIEAVATVPVFRFRDDVTITITSEAGAAVVNVRSRSRVGKSDLGENARRIRRFQAALAAKLGR